MVVDLREIPRDPAFEQDAVLFEVELVADDRSGLSRVDVDDDLSVIVVRGSHIVAGVLTVRVEGAGGAAVFVDPRGDAVPEDVDVVAVVARDDVHVLQGAAEAVAGEGDEEVVLRGVGLVPALAGVLVGLGADLEVTDEDEIVGGVGHVVRVVAVGRQQVQAGEELSVLHAVAVGAVVGVAAVAVDTVVGVLAGAVHAPRHEGEGQGQREQAQVAGHL